MKDDRGAVPPDPAEGIPDPEDAPEGWRVDGLTRAARTMERCRQLQAEVDAVTAHAAAEIERVQEWAAGEVTRLKGRQAWYLSYLDAYARALREADPDRKTIALPGGTLTTKTVTEQGSAWTVDQAAVQEWAAGVRPDLIKWTPKFALAEAKREMKAVGGRVYDTDGGEVPGLTPQPEVTTVTFTYRRLDKDV